MKDTSFTISVFFSALTAVCTDSSFADLSSDCDFLSVQHSQSKLKPSK